MLFQRIYLIVIINFYSKDKVIINNGLQYVTDN